MRKLLGIAIFSLFAASLQAQTLTATISNYPARAPWNVQCTATVTKNCVSGWRIFNVTSGRVALFDVPANATVTGGTASGPIAVWSGGIVAATIGKDANGVEVLSADSARINFTAPAPDAPSGTTIIVITVAP